MQRRCVDLRPISAYFPHGEDPSPTIVSPDETISKRRLSAIMFTDMVGYSALTQKNEAQALELLQEHNRLLRAVFPRHHGTEIKTIGDAFLVEFTSALDAVQCAIDIQRTLHEEHGRSGSGPALQVRIGVHLGDVVHKDDDVFGDGVNIAARIYPAARPGGICISESIAQQVQNKIEFPVRALAPRELKNIAAQIRLFDVALPWLPARRPGMLLPPRWLSRARTTLFFFAVIVLAYWLYEMYLTQEDASLKRIAVLPFRNITARAEHEFFAEGMTEELISSLSRISGLEVIARTSVNQYKEASLGFGAIGNKLNAGSLIEGSVRAFGDSVRVTVRLIEAASERLLWDEDYNRPSANALKIQDDIAMNVAGALRVQLLEAEKADLLNQSTTSPDAWRLYLLGKYHLNRRTSGDVMKSVTYFIRSTDLDSVFAAAYAGLAEAYTLVAGAGYGSVPREKALSEAIHAADKALRCNPRLAEAHAVRGYILYRLLWNWKDADSLFRRAIELKPSFAKGHEWYGLYLALKGNTAEGLVEMKKAASLDPHSPSVATGVGRLLAFDRQFQESIEWLKRVIAEHPGYAEAYFALALSQAYAAKYVEALPNLEKAIEMSGRRDVILAEYAATLARVGRQAEARSILAELDSVSRFRPVSLWITGMIHASLGDYDKAFDQIERGLDEREGLLVYLKSDPLMDELREHPRFKNLIRKIWNEE